MPGTVSDAIMTPLGHQQITAATLATAQTLTVPTGAVYALIQAASSTGVKVRWRDDGTAPTASIGMQLGSDMWYCGNLAAIQFIREAAGVTLEVSYYKPAAN